MEEYTAHRFLVMGTMAEILAVGLDRRSLLEAADMLNDLEDRWSRFRPTSEISQLNRHADDALRTGTPTPPVVVSQDTFLLVNLAVEACRQSGGAFDPTVGSSMYAAGYHRSFELLTDHDPTGPYRPAPGVDGITLDADLQAITLPPGVKLDLGGLAKGLAADLLAERLLAIGASGCCVNLGGDLRAIGTAPRPEGWQIGIDCPGAARTVTVGLAAGAVCTTSKAKRRWGPPDGDGVDLTEHHLRDPATGQPLETGVASITVIAARATQAEVLCKMAFAAGPTLGPELVAGRGATGLLVHDDTMVTEMPGLDIFTASAIHQTQPVASLMGSTS